MTNQIEKNKKLQENLSVEDLKKQIAEGKLSDLDSKIPENDESDNFADINYKNNILTPDQTERELADIYLNTLENQENHLKYSQNPDNKQKKIGNKAENIYNTESGFVGPDEAADIKLVADQERQKSNNKVMDMIPDWLKRFVS